MSIKTREEKITMVGNLGEKIVAAILRDKGHKVEESLNVFDREKDMLVDGMKAEVKTQVPFINKRAFTFRESQLMKAFQVDLLFFVSIPSMNNPWSGNIYQMWANKGAFIHNRYNITFKGQSWPTKMVSIPIEQPLMQLLFKIEDTSILGQLSHLSGSDYGKE